MWTLCMYCMQMEMHHGTAFKDHIIPNKGEFNYWSLSVCMNEVGMNICEDVDVATISTAQLWIRTKLYLHMLKKLPQNEYI